MHCAYRIFTEEGVRRFWTGTTPRLARLVVRYSLFPFSLSILLYASLNGILDEWGHSLHDLRESYRPHWWTRIIENGNEYRHYSFTYSVVSSD